MKKHKIFLAVAMILAMLATGCDNDIFGVKAPVSVSISRTLMEFETISEVSGRTLQLEASVTLKDGTTSNDVTWTVPSDTEAFRVSSTSGGRLTFQIRKSGTYIVTANAMYKGSVVKTADCVIAVYDALQELMIRSVTDGNTVFTGNLEIFENTKIELEAVFSPVNTSQTNVIWSVDNPNVLSLTEEKDGKVTMTSKKAGDAVVTLTSSDNRAISANVNVHVSASGAGQKFGLSHIALSDRVKTVPVGTSVTVTAEVFDGNKNAISDGDCEFSLSGGSSFAITGEGSRTVTLTAMRAGSCTLTAQYSRDGQTVASSCVLTVEGDVISIAPSSGSVNLDLGASDTYYVTYDPADTAHKGIDVKVSPSSGLTVSGIASDGSSFTVYGEKTGTYDVLISSSYNPAVTASMKVTVLSGTQKGERIQKIEMSPTVVRMTPPYDPETVTASVYRRSDNGTVAVDPSYGVVFSIEDSEVASFVQNGNSAELTAKKPGTTKLIARSADSDEITAETEVFVEGTLIALQPEQETLNLTVGESATVGFNAVPYYARFSLPVSSVTEDCVSVSVWTAASGAVFADVRGEKAGSCRIRFSVDGVEMADIDVNVYPENVVRIKEVKLSENVISLKQDADRYAFTATAVASDGSTVSDAEINFAPSDSVSEKIAQVEKVAGTNDTFYVYPLNAGAADYIFRVGDDATATARLRIEVGGSAVQGAALRELRSPMDSLTLVKGNSTGIELTTVPFGAEAGWIYWDSEDGSVCSIGYFGGLMATLFAYNAGTTKITASTATGVSVSFTVNVVETAGAVDSTIAYATAATSDGEPYFIARETGKTLNIFGRAYTVDGSPVAGEKFDWTVEGDGVLGTAPARGTGFSVVTNAFNTLETPAIVRAVSVSNPNVSAEFRVYVNSSLEISEKTPIVTPKYTGVTLAVGDTLEIPYEVKPETADPDLVLSLSGTAVSADIDTAEKKITVRAKEKGVSSITASCDGVSFRIAVTVVDTAEITDNAISGVRLDRSYLSYDIAKKAPQKITATVYRNGVASLADNVTWTYDEKLATLAISGNTATIVPVGTTGRFEITATAAGNREAKASCLVEVIDSTDIAETLRYIELPESSMSMTAGETRTLKATAVPASLTAGMVLDWSSDDEDVATVAGGVVTAVGAGKTTIRAQARGTDISAGCVVTVHSEGADSNYSLASVKLDPWRYTIPAVPSSEYGVHIKAMGVTQAGEEIETEVAGWRLLDEKGKELLTIDKNGYRVGTVVSASFPRYDEFFKTGCVEFHDASVYGENRNRIRLSPSVPGLYYLEASIAGDRGKAVTGKAVITVTGTLAGVSLGSSYIHMVKGESMTLSATLDPYSASLLGYSWTAGKDGSKTVSLSDTTKTSAVLTATAEGTATVTYSATDRAGNTMTADVTVVVHDRSYGTGGIRSVAFDKSFKTFTFPYSTETFKATAVYMDGTAADDSDLAYTVYEAYKSADGSDIAVQPSNGGGAVRDGDGKTVATFSIGQSGVRVTPVAVGSFMIRACLTKNVDGVEENYVSDMYVTVSGNSNSISLSSSSVILYTGGSASISVKSDNPAYDGARYRYTLLSEYTRDGYKIVNDTIEGQGEEMESIFTATAGTSSGGSIVIGTKTLLTSQSARQNYAQTGAGDGVNVIGEGFTSDAQMAPILATFPRTALFMVSTEDGQSTAEIGVTVNILPNNNSYPVSLSLNAVKVDLAPPFSTENTITASLLDLYGKATEGTLNWYYYPLGTDNFRDEDSGYRLDTTARNDGKLIYAYFGSDGTTMYYRPKTAGVYRLTAECVQNPQLTATATFSVSGDVTKISASCGASLTLNRGSSAEITPVFTPANALSRPVYWGIHERDAVTNTSYTEMIGDTVYENEYINMQITEEGAMVTGVKATGTSGGNYQLLYLVYPKSSSMEIDMKAALAEPDVCLKIRGSYAELVKKGTEDDGDGGVRVTYTPTGREFEVYYTTVRVDVVVEKALYTLSVSGESELNPNEVGASSLTYRAGNSVSGTNSTSTFPGYEWTEMKVLSEENQKVVYASSVPIFRETQSADPAVREKYKGASLYEGPDGRYYPFSAEAGGLDMTVGGLAPGDLRYYNAARTERYVSLGEGQAAVDATVYTLKEKDKSYDVYLSGAEWVRVTDEAVLERAVAMQLSSQRDGKINRSESEYTFTINQESIPNEPVYMTVKPADNITTMTGYDAETMDFKAGSRLVYIGSPIQSLRIGQIVANNNSQGMTSESVDVSKTDAYTLYEGASCVLDMKYNPAYTHQTNVIYRWTIENPEAASVNQSGNSLYIKANRIPGQATECDIRITVLSADNPNIRTANIFTVQIASTVKVMTFTASSEQILNKGQAAEPIYRALDSTLYPKTETDDEIYCFDAADSVGNVDSYLVKATPTPNFNHTFTFTVKSGAEVGEIDTTSGLDKDSNSFHFVPRGRIYNRYNSDGTADTSSGFTVNYGRMTVNVSNSDLMYSKDFVINYQPSGLKIAKGLEHAHDSHRWQSDWDAVRIGTGQNGNGVFQILGQECILLTATETDGVIGTDWYPVTLIKTATEDAQKKGAVPFTDFSAGYDVNDPFYAENCKIEWKVVTSKAATEESGLLKLYNVDGNAFDNESGFTAAAGNRASTPGIAVAVAKDGNGVPKQGACYLIYTYSFPQTQYDSATGKYSYIMVNKVDERGEVVYELDPATGLSEPVKVPLVTKITGGIPVYVVSPADPELVLAAEYMLGSQNAVYARMIPEKISRGQYTKWYGVSPVTSVLSETGSVLDNVKMYRGVAYAVFSEKAEGVSAVLSASAPKSLEGLTVDFVLNRNLFMDSGLSDRLNTGVLTAGARESEGMVFHLNADAEQPYSRLLFPNAKRDMNSVRFTGQGGLACLPGIKNLTIDLSEFNDVGRQNFYSWLSGTVEGTGITFSESNLSVVDGVRKLDLAGSGLETVGISYAGTTGEGMGSFDTVVLPATVKNIELRANGFGPSFTLTVSDGANEAVFGTAEYVAMGVSKNLVKVDLSENRSCPFTGDAKMVLRGMENLKELILNDTALNGLLLSGATNLEKLDLTDTGAQPGATVDDAVNVVELSSCGTAKGFAFIALPSGRFGYSTLRATDSLFSEFALCRNTEGDRHKKYVDVNTTAWAKEVAFDSVASRAVPSPLKTIEFTGTTTFADGIPFDVSGLKSLRSVTLPQNFSATVFDADGAGALDTLKTGAGISFKAVILNDTGADSRMVETLANAISDSGASRADWSGLLYAPDANVTGSLAISNPDIRQIYLANHALETLSVDAKNLNRLSAPGRETTLKAATITTATGKLGYLDLQNGLLGDSGAGAVDYNAMRSELWRDSEYDESVFMTEINRYLSQNSKGYGYLLDASSLNSLLSTNLFAMYLARSEGIASFSVSPDTGELKGLDGNGRTLVNFSKDGDIVNHYSGRFRSGKYLSDADYASQSLSSGLDDYEATGAQFNGIDSEGNGAALKEYRRRITSEGKASAIYHGSADNTSGAGLTAGSFVFEGTEDAVKTGIAIAERGSVITGRSLANTDTDSFPNRGRRFVRTVQRAGTPEEAAMHVTDEKGQIQYWNFLTFSDGLPADYNRYTDTPVYTYTFRTPSGASGAFNSEDQIPVGAVITGSSITAFKGIRTAARDLTANLECWTILTRDSYLNGYSSLTAAVHAKVSMTVTYEWDCSAYYDRSLEDGYTAPASTDFDFDAFATYLVAQRGAAAGLKNCVNADGGTLLLKSDGTLLEYSRETSVKMLGLAVPLDPADADSVFSGLSVNGKVYASQLNKGFEAIPGVKELYLANNGLSILFMYSGGDGWELDKKVSTATGKINTFSLVQNPVMLSGTLHFEHNGWWQGSWDSRVSFSDVVAFKRTVTQGGWSSSNPALQLYYSSGNGVFLNGESAYVEITITTDDWWMWASTDIRVYPFG